MYLLAWIFIGVLVGWAAGRLLEGNGYGPFMDVVMGIGGAVAGGLLMRAAGLRGIGGTVVTTMVAVIGAALLTMVVGFANGRRIYARAS
jgi:uncharacterized membrane protein YeaQ/YmgE (transglycosylase-associated protein family)